MSCVRFSCCFIIFNFILKPYFLPRNHAQKCIHKLCKTVLLRNLYTRIRAINSFAWSQSKALVISFHLCSSPRVLASATGCASLVCVCWFVANSIVRAIVPIALSPFLCVVILNDKPNFTKNFFLD